ncbi:hypothetical protein AZ34_17480 [Hylemonella gracilis str. Niagara R]|uniref:Uncharacterized protein n=1 Tax=Hylemonella gracilis str. Niagara R TaxID=1458275 RepID=A0A016XN32_9BURK|nr:hypothetical protein [Hylemonella gracilis]EYC52982.1 hypothetical protein AZ34_17480 [Hylemonella gracilis str. Niagara R]
MISTVNNTLLGYLASQGLLTPVTAGNIASAGNKTESTDTSSSSKETISQTSLDRAAGMFKTATVARNLETAQVALAADLRAALEKALVKLSEPVQFSVNSKGEVEVKGNEKDKAAVQAVLKADTSDPSLANRIATQASDAMALSNQIQQSAAISQAAKSSKTPDGVISLYQSLMQQTASTSVVFSVSATSSSLTYPGSLKAKA